MPLKYTQLLMALMAGGVIQSSASPAHVGIGLPQISYYDGSQAYADLARHGTAKNLAWGAATVDANGDPVTDFQHIVSSTKLAAGTYKIVFTGRASIGPSAGTIQGQTYLGNTTTADWVVPSLATGNVWVGFGSTYRTGGSTVGDGITGLQIWRHGYPTDGSVLFTTEFITAMKKFKTLRGMDFVQANLNPQTTWATRTPPSYFGNTGDNGQAWEMLIAVANATDRDVWLNVPAKADNDYIQKLAQLVKYGSDGVNPYTSVQASPVYAPLKSTLKVYAEYGNEIWNSGPGFNGYGWALAEANANKGDVTHPIAYDGVITDQYIALRRWIAFRSASIALIFKDIFVGSAGQVRPIFSAQVGNGNTYLSKGLQWAAAFFDAPRTGSLWDARLGASRAISTNEIWYGGGGAAYYDSTVAANDTLPETMTTYFANLPTANFATTTATDAVWAHAFGLKLVSYEGGPAPGGSSLGGSTATAEVSYTYSADPRMKDRMLVAQDVFNANGGDELHYYVYSGPAPWSFANGVVLNTVSDTDTVKLNAIDEIAVRPQAAVTIGTVVPATVYLKGAGTNVIGYDGASWKLSGTVYRLSTASGYVLVPVRATGAGNYQLSLNVPSSSGNATAKIHVEGQLVGSVNVPDNTTNVSAQTASVPVSLAAGLSVIRVTLAATGDLFIKDIVVQAT